MEFKVSVTADKLHNDETYRLYIRTYKVGLRDTIQVEEVKPIKFNPFDENEKTYLLGSGTIELLHWLGFTGLENTVQSHIDFLESLGCEPPHFYTQEEIERIDAEERYNNDLGRGEI